MHPGSSDPNPWIIANEMTVDGCRGFCRPSDAASLAGGSTKNSGKPPASDGQPPPENPNATSGPNRHQSTQKHHCTPWTPQKHRDGFQLLREEISGKSSSYVLSNRGQSPMSVPASSHEYQVSGYLDHLIPAKDTPRIISNQQYQTNVEVRCMTKPVPSGPHEALSGPPGPSDQKGRKVPHKNIRKQDARVTKNPDAELRQLDTESDPEKDANTDDESSQEPSRAGKDCGEN